MKEDCTKKDAKDKLLIALNCERELAFKLENAALKLHDEYSTIREHIYKNMYFEKSAIEKSWEPHRVKNVKIYIRGEIKKHSMWYLGENSMKTVIQYNKIEI